MRSDWAVPYYYSIGDYYKQRIGEKTYKISVTIADDCPNRRGLSNMETCIFCDEWGSAAYKDSINKSLQQQIEEYHAKLKANYKSDSFLIYFQSYTSTFMGIKALRECFDLALSYPFVKGIVIGTRPDCISKANINMWNEYAEKGYLSVELGVQSFFQEQVDFLKRGHGAEKSISAIQKIKTECPKVDVGVHFIFGIPGENPEEIKKSAQIASDLKVDSVKIHNLHVLKNTGLEQMYKAGEFQPVDLDEFSEVCITFLEHLSPEIPVHRLGALASRWDELIAPQWNRFKMQTRQYILDRMRKENRFQGRLFEQTPGIAALHNPRIGLKIGH